MATTKLYANKDGEKAQVAFIRLGTANGSDKVVRIQRGMQVLYDDWPVCTISANAEHTTGIVPATLRYGQPWAAVLITDSGYGIDTVEILMNGEDITQEAYQDGVISIPRVTGNVAINVETASVTDTNMFTKRTTGNGITILNDKALLKGVRGNSLVLRTNLIGDKTEYTNIGLTISRIDKVYHISGTCNTTTSFVLLPRFTSNSTHKYFCYFSGTHNFERLDFGNSGNLPTTLQPIIITYNSSTTAGVTIGVKKDVTYDVTFTFWMIDLTNMFGKGNEPSTVAKFRQLFPLDDYDYTSCIVLNNSMTKYVSKKYDAVGSTLVNATNKVWTEAPISGAAPAVTPVDGIFTLTVNSQRKATLRSRESIGIAGNKYYWACYLKAPSGKFRFCNYGGTVQNVTIKHDGWELVSRIHTGSLIRCDFNIYEATVGDEIQFKEPIYANLTNMFGAGNEPSLDVCNYIYNSIPSWKTADSFNTWNLIDRVGKSTNIWDEQAEKGYIDASGNLVNGNYVRSVNYIPVTPNTRIYWNYTSDGTYDLQIARYDAEKTFIERVGAVGSYLIPSDTYHIKFYLHANYGTTYRNNVILSTNPAPVYEPLNKVSALDVTNATGKLNGEGESVVIFPNGMKSTVCLPSVTPSYISKYDSKASYFDLDYVPTGNDIVIKGKIRFNSYISTAANLIWFAASGNGNKFRIIRSAASNNVNLLVQNGSSTFKEFSSIVLANNTYEFELSQSALKWNGTVYPLTVTEGTENTYSMKLLNGINCYFYYFQIYKAEELVVDCIPYRNGDVIGLQDRARNNRIFTLTQASGEGVVNSCEPTYEELPEPVYDEIKQDGGVWKAYKRIGNIRVDNDVNTGRYEYAPLAQEEVYVLDDQTIPTELSVANQGTEEILPTNGATPTTAPTIMEIQYGSIPQNNLLGGGLLGGMLGGSNNGGGSDDDEQEDDEPDYEEPVNEEESEEPVEEDDTN